MTALETYSGQFKMMDGTLDVTTGYGVVYAVESEVGCDVSITANGGVYTIASVADDNASAIFSATYASVKYYRTFTVAKSREAAGTGSAKRIILNTNTFQFFYDEKNQPASQSATLSVNRFNISVDPTWRILKLDGTLIAEGSAASLVSSGFATSSANTAQLIINQSAFDALIRANGTNAIVIEVECVDGLSFRDRVTLFQVIQLNKVTWEGISDPNGTKADLEGKVNDAYDEVFTLKSVVEEQLLTPIEDYIDLIGEMGLGVQLAQDKAMRELHGQHTVLINSIETKLFGIDGTIIEAIEAQGVEIQTNLEGLDTELRSLITTTAATAADATEAVALNLTTLTTTVANSVVTLESSIADLDTSVTTLVETQADRVTQIESRIDDVGGATIEEKFSTQAGLNGDLQAAYYLKAQTETGTGRLLTAGIGVLADATSGTEVAVLAERFLVSNGTSSTIPFQIIDGVVYINAAYIRDASIVNAHIQNLAVGTNKIAIDAVTVVHNAALGTPVTGTGSFSTVLSHTINAPYDCVLTVLVSASQGFPSGDRTWNLRSYGSSGQQLSAAGGMKTSDSVSLAGSYAITAGTHTTTVSWQGGDSSVSLSSCTMVILEMRR